MRALVQRVSEASVEVNGRITGSIGRGILVFLGIRHDDSEENADYLANKVTQLRIFPDQEGKMNLGLRDISGEILVVSQFTLYGQIRSGNRPSYSAAAKPEVAVRLYEYFLSICGKKGFKVASGVFQAQMKVSSVNDGPVTLMCSSEHEILST